MRDQDPVATVQAIYAAFGAGDLPALLARLHPDVEWEWADHPNPVPWLQPRRGRDQVPAFFEALGQVEMERFQPKHFAAFDGLVVVVLDATFRVKASGRRVVERDETHLWQVDADGLVTRFRHRVDTWQHAQALAST